MRINHNMMAINTHRQLGVNGLNQKKSMEKLSSGKRINRAADDAAGLAISEKMRAQIRGLKQASRNAQDGISLIQTAEGALDEVSNMLVRHRELRIQYENGTYNDSDRAKIELEQEQLNKEISNIIENTKFNGKKILDGRSALKIVVSDDAKLALDIPEAGTQFDDIKTLGSAIKHVSAVAPVLSAPGVSAKPGVPAHTTNGIDINKISAAAGAVNQIRATFGAMQNRLEATVRNLNNNAENLQAAESRIRDVDMAEEMMNYTKNNILIQATQSMLAQANQTPQGVLQLLR